MRRPRDSKLDSRTARLKAKVSRHPYARTLQRGVALLYYRGATRGSWSVRVFVGKAAGRRPYVEAELGQADDFAESDGKSILTFSEAVAAAFDKAQAIATGQRHIGPYTVLQAVNDYLADAEAKKKSFRDIKARLERHVTPLFGARRVSSLTHGEIEEWHRDLAKLGAFKRPKNNPTGGRKRQQVKDPRARKVSANRELSYFKAALNRAYKLGHAKDNSAWRLVQPFEGVEQPRVQFLSAAEAERLINACEDPAFRDLVQGALLTGCRYGELGRLRALDYDAERGIVFIEKAKAGRARHVPLSREGVALFDRLTVGKLREALIFLRANGRGWGPSDNLPPMKVACARAKLQGYTFHQLRHTYASALAGVGVSMKIIAENLGHYDTAITEKHYAHLIDSVRHTAVQLLPSFGIVIPKKAKTARIR